MDFALVIGPSNAEFDDALGLAHSLQQAGLFIFGMLCHHIFDALENFFDSLDEQIFAGIAGFDLVQHSLHVSVHFDCLLNFCVKCSFSHRHYLKAQMGKCQERLIKYR